MIPSSALLAPMLCALIISGLVAHPKIFKDAFNFRTKGSRHLEQADIHNGLSVWGVPFHLMIAITGAYFGLALPILAVFADARYDGDREAVIASVFGRGTGTRPARRSAGDRKRAPANENHRSRRNAVPGHRARCR